MYFTVRNGRRRCRDASEDYMKDTRVAAAAAVAADVRAYTRVHIRQTCVPKRVQWRIGAILSGRSGRAAIIHRAARIAFHTQHHLYVCGHGPRAKVCGRRHVRRA